MSQRRNFKSDREQKKTPCYLDFNKKFTQSKRLSAEIGPFFLRKKFGAFLFRSIYRLLRVAILRKKSANAKNYFRTTNILNANLLKKKRKKRNETRTDKWREIHTERERDRHRYVH